MVNLQITRNNLELIRSGKKKCEWRHPSVYNKKLLFCDRGDGKRDGNPDIKEITFINGYRKDCEKLKVEVLGIRLVKFIKDIVIADDNFSAKAEQFAIEIKLGNIIN